MNDSQTNTVLKIVDLLPYEDWEKCSGFADNTDIALLLPIDDNCVWTLHPHGIEEPKPMAILSAIEEDDIDLFVGEDDTLPLAMCVAWLKWKSEGRERGTSHCKGTPPKPSKTPYTRSGG